jgi:hypothetical protein
MPPPPNFVHAGSRVVASDTIGLNKTGDNQDQFNVFCHSPNRPLSWNESQRTPFRIFFFEHIVAHQVR